MAPGHTVPLAGSRARAGGSKSHSRLSKQPTPRVGGPCRHPKGRQRAPRRRPKEPKPAVKAAGATRRRALPQPKGAAEGPAPAAEAVEAGHQSNLPHQASGQAEQITAVPITGSGGPRAGSRSRPSRQLAQRGAGPYRAHIGPGKAPRQQLKDPKKVDQEANTKRRRPMPQPERVAEGPAPASTTRRRAVPHPEGTAEGPSQAAEAARMVRARPCQQAADAANTARHRVAQRLEYSPRRPLKHLARRGLR